MFGPFRGVLIKMKVIVVNRRSGVTVLVLACGWWCAAAMGGEEPVRQERLEFDPSRGWIEQAPPEPGTPEGDLGLARADFAQDHYRSAYKKIKKWIKTYGPDHELYPQAAILRAEIEIARHDYYKAHKHLQEFLNEFSGTEYAERAVELEFNIAEVFLSGKRRKFLGVRILKADDIGISILDELAATYPESNIAELAMKTKADHYYSRALDFASAEMEYAALIKEFPRSRYTRQAQRRSADSALATFPGIEFDDAPLIEAEERYRDYVAMYPGAAEQEGVGLILQEIRSKRAAKEFEVGRYYERTGKDRAAAFYYRSTMNHWPDTIAATRARERLSKMGALDESPATAPAPSEDESSPVLEERRP
jgi:outer membrane protein assembly factor BamD (BamD/ComL family)